jgi:hypothetical protein
MTHVQQSPLAIPPSLCSCASMARVWPLFALAAALLSDVVCVASSAACKGTDEGEGGRTECRDVSGSLIRVNIGISLFTKLLSSIDGAWWMMACVDAHDRTYANIYAHFRPHMAPGLNVSTIVTLTR